MTLLLAPFQGDQKLRLWNETDKNSNHDVLIFSVDKTQILISSEKELDGI